MYIDESASMLKELEAAFGQPGAEPNYPVCCPAFKNRLPACITACALILLLGC